MTNGFSKEFKEQLVRIANSMINNEIDIVKGCRQICSIIPKLNCNLINEDIFLGFLAFESDTDIYPIGDDRKHYNERYLAELDQKREYLIEHAYKHIIEDCHTLISTLNKT